MQCLEDFQKNDPRLGDGWEDSFVARLSKEKEIILLEMVLACSPVTYLESANVL